MRYTVAGGNICLYMYVVVDQNLNPALIRISAHELGYHIRYHSQLRRNKIREYLVTKTEVGLNWLVD